MNEKNAIPSVSNANALSEAEGASVEAEGASVASVKTSVVIPVYNSEEFLADCIDSVLAQTQKEIEVILVDDGSTDGSLQIERDYEKRDPRVKVITQPNLRQGTARNRGLAIARGKYVYFMDSDDLIVPEHFETCYEACEKDNLDFVTFDSYGFFEDPNVERPDLFNEVTDRSGMLPTTVFDGPTFWTANPGFNTIPWICWLEYLRRDFVLENNLQFKEKIYFEDNDWIVRLYLAAKRMKYIPVTLHRYRHNPHSNVHAGFSEQLAWSCFDVFNILDELRTHELETSAPEERAMRVRMVENVILGMSERFREFSFLKPKPDLVNKTIEFERDLRKKCADEQIPLDRRQIFIRVLANVITGLTWWGQRKDGYPWDLIKKLTLVGLPTPQDAKRLGIYGTGLGCDLLLGAWDTSAFDLVFIETNPKPGKQYAWDPTISAQVHDGADIDASARPDPFASGIWRESPNAVWEPVHGADEITALNLDAIVITSEKYAVPIRQVIDELTQGSIPVYKASRHLLAFKEILPALDVSR